MRQLGWSIGILTRNQNIYPFVKQLYKTLLVSIPKISGKPFFKDEVKYVVQICIRFDKQNKR